MGMFAARSCSTATQPHDGLSHSEISWKYLRKLSVQMQQRGLLWIMPLRQWIAGGGARAKCNVSLYFSRTRCRGRKMLAAEIVTAVWVVAFAFLVFVLQQQAEDRQVERHTRSFVLRLAQRYREQYEGWSLAPEIDLSPRDGHGIGEHLLSAGPSQFAAEPVSRLRQRQEPRIGVPQTANDARKRAA